jgi:hypothetical protein
MRERQLGKNLFGDVIVSAIVESKPTGGSWSLATLNSKPIVGMNVPSSNLRGRNVSTPVASYTANAASTYLNQEPAAAYVELERQ